MGYQPLYCGEYGYEFRSHYYRLVGGFDSREEYECAQMLDAHPAVKYWVRNPVRSDQSFWLPTSTGRFYPDFVCLLKDGRRLVVEYKGADRWSNAEETAKRQIGQWWEARSRGQCLFIMPKGKDFDAVRAKLR